MTVIDRIADRLTGEVGYRETPVNRTKYSAELDAVEKPRLGRQGSPWCGSFIDWGFWKEGALAALPVGTVWTPGAARRYHDIGRWTQAGPRRGDLAFLNRLGDHGHVGYVLEVRGGFVRSCEGNTTTSAAGSQANGGEVAVKVRSISWWAGGFGQPFYEVIHETPMGGKDVIQFVRVANPKLPPGVTDPVWLSSNASTLRWMASPQMLADTKQLLGLSPDYPVHEVGSLEDLDKWGVRVGPLPPGWS